MENQGENNLTIASQWLVALSGVAFLRINRQQMAAIAMGCGNAQLELGRRVIYRI